MIGEAIASGVTALGNFIGQKQQFKHEKYLQNLNYARQVGQDEKQYKRDLEMWHLANAYNAPKAQMQRFKEGGLNPNLIYGKGSASAGVASSTMPKYQATRPNMDYSAPSNVSWLGSVLSAYNDWRMTNAQIDLVKEQKRIKQAEADFADDYFRYRNLGKQYGSDVQGIKFAGLAGHNYKDSYGNIVKYDKAPFGRMTEYSLGMKDAQIRNIENQIDWRNKQMEYYLYKIFGPMIINGVGKTAGAVLGLGKMRAGAKVAQNLSTPRRVLPRNFESFQW